VKRLRAILCADWSRERRKREVYLADTRRREVRRLEGPWTAARVIEAAREAAGDDAALATFDAPIGVPISYWQKLQEFPGVAQDLASFAAWLPEAVHRPGWFDNAPTPRDWRIDRPFFAIAPVAGGRRIWQDALARAGVATLRHVDELTGANPAFVTSGIPGTAGSGARELWKELGLILSGRDRVNGETDSRAPTEAGLAIWPFDGPTDELLAEHTVVVGENYPRAAYALALSRGDPEARARLRIAKTRWDVRQAALGDLQSHPWLVEHGVRLNDIGAAADSEDAFDALFAAAGLLRCVLESTPFARDELVDPVAEGGILGTGSLDLTLREVTYVIKTKTPPRKPRSSRRNAVMPDMRPRLAGAPRTPQPPAEPVYPCPIPGCDHVFTRSRAGWDAHVASVRIHPRWKADVRDPDARKKLFRQTYPSFFRNRE
jgi:hypothetical protein